MKHVQTRATIRTHYHLAALDNSTTCYIVDQQGMKNIAHTSQDQWEKKWDWHYCQDELLAQLNKQ